MELSGTEPTQTPATHLVRAATRRVDRVQRLRGRESRGSYWFVVGRDFCRLEFVAAGAQREPGACKGIWDALHSVDLGCLGERPVQVTLTYPGNWRKWVWDVTVLRAHFRRFQERWYRRWGERLVGMWKIEFQRRGAPHIHMYVKLPEAVAREDYEGLRKRTVDRARLEEQYGARGGGDRERAVDGEFGMWARTAWAESVGTQVRGRWNDLEGRRHHAKGVDVSRCFWFGKVPSEVERLRCMRYLAKELGKRTQDDAPEGFGRVQKQWGFFRSGYRRDVQAVRVGRGVAEVLDAMLRELVAEGVPAEWGGGKGLGWDCRALRDRWGWGVPRYGITAEGSWEVLRRAEMVAEMTEAGAAGDSPVD